MAPATVASQLRSVQEEIGALRDALGNVQNRLADLTRQAIDERTSLLTQIEELQLENEQLQNDGRWLRTQNQDLEHKSEVKMPELDNALEARNAAVRRLRRCQRVVRDLLDERLEDQVQEGPAAVTTGSKKLPDEVVERMAREVLGDATPTGTTTSSSLRTADQRRRGRQSGRPVKLPTISQQGATGDHSGGNTSLSAVTQNTTDDVPAAAVIPQPVEAETERDRSKDANETTAIVGQAGPSGQETGSSQTEYTVVSGKPKFLPRPWGPTKWDELPVQLKSAGIDAEFKLDEIKTSNDACIHLSILEEFAFVMDPIFLESAHNKQSYFIDWGDIERHEDIAKYLENSRGGRTMLHTFIFLSKEGWFYIGALSWSVAKLPSELWPLLPNKKRELVTTKLAERSQGGLKKEQVEQLLDDGRFTQFCIELSSKGHQQEMWEFMGKMGYRRISRDPPK